MEFTEREKQVLVWLLLREYGDRIEQAHKVAGDYLDCPAGSPMREELEKQRVSLNERISFLCKLMAKLGYSPEEVQQ